MKKRTVFTAVFALLVIVAVGCGFYALRQKQAREIKENETPESAYTLCDEPYGQAAQYMDVKLYESDIDGLFYALNPVQYFRVNAGRLEAVKPAETLHVSPTVGNVKMSFDIPFVKVGKAVFGVGVWHSDAGVYNDGFAVLKQMPKVLGDTAYMLLIDTHARDASATQRLYSEVFFCTKDGTVGGYVFDQRNRTVEPSGKLRTDWDALKLSMLSDDEVLHLSAKKYSQDSQNQPYDLMRTTAGKTETIAKAVSDTWLWKEEKVCNYLKADKQPTVYALVGNKKAQKVVTLDGSLADYRFAGKFALKEETNTILNLTGSAVPTKEADFKVVYDCGATGDYLVLIGKEENKDGEKFKVQKIAVYDLSRDAAQELCANDIMDEESNLLTCREGIVTVRDGKSVFISYTDIATILQNVV